jgi:DNA-binding NtrC family response regulator
MELKLGEERLMTRILVVDDEPDMLEHMAWAAQGNDREVVTAKNAEEAIKLINRDIFDVVATDLYLELGELGKPRGFSVLRSTKEKDLDAQVIVLTSWGTPETGPEAMRLGAYDYIERGSGGEWLTMLRKKISQAIEFRDAKIKMRKEGLA